MWRNTLNTLVADPPESRVLKQRRKFPAGIFELGNKGWLYQVFSFRHFGSIQVVLTKTSEPFSLASTSGLSALQMVQNLNSNSNFDKKTMCFGSDLRFEPLSDNLERNKSHVGKTCGTKSLDTLTHKQMAHTSKKEGSGPNIFKKETVTGFWNITKYVQGVRSNHIPVFAEFQVMQQIKH